MSVNHLLILGGGQMAQAIATTVCSLQDWKVNVALPEGEVWSPNLFGTELKAWTSEVLATHSGKNITTLLLTNPVALAHAASQADVILVPGPSPALADVLRKLQGIDVKPTVWLGVTVGFNGFFWAARSILPSIRKLFCTQRTPFVAYCPQGEYGQHVMITARKPDMKVGFTGGEFTELSPLLSRIFGMSFLPLVHPLEAMLIPTNPVLHPARLYSCFGEEWWDGKPLAHKPLFYVEWDDRSSKNLQDLDADLAALRSALRTAIGVSQPSGDELIVDHLCSQLAIEGGAPYDVAVLRPYSTAQTPAQVTDVVKHFFATLTVPVAMVPAPSGEGFLPDLSHRHWREDLALSLPLIVGIGRILGVATPTLERVLAWGRKMLGIDPNEDVLAARFGILTREQLLAL